MSLLVLYVCKLLTINHLWAVIFPLLALKHLKYSCSFAMEEVRFIYVNQCLHTEYKMHSIVFSIMCKEKSKKKNFARCS